LNLTITVSPVVISDIPQILEIENECQPEPWTEKAFLEEIDKAYSQLLAARLATGASNPGRPPQDVAGYVCFWSVAGEIQILDVAVRRDLRRRGIGRKLIEAAIRAGREENAGCVTLEVRESNLAASKLYETLGFRIIGRRPNYYEVTKESAILMELDIAMHRGKTDA
jgi:ribosomal-protein-alanine N-acetyltransferase